MSAISCQQRQFGTLETGQLVTSYTLRNASGMTVSLLNYGAILNAVQIPDIRGEMHEVTFKSSQLSDLQTHSILSGATLPHLPQRYGINLDVIKRSIWQADSVTYDKAASVKLTLKGKLDLKYSLTQLDYQCTTEYTLTDTNELVIRSDIQTSIPLPFYITHHPCWNLTGAEAKDVDDHILQIWAAEYATMDALGFTKDEYFDIHNNPAFNFQQPQRIGEKRAQVSSDEDYSVCFKLNTGEDSIDPASPLPLVARVKAPVSGRTLEVYTRQHALHFYLQSCPTEHLQGFCLSPMPLLHTNAQSKTPSSIQHETCYKLIW